MINMLINQNPIIVYSLFQIIDCVIERTVYFVKKQQSPVKKA